jgi:hypothetical protein
MDSVHPTQETKITYRWVRKEVEKQIARVAFRKRVNLTGAIDLNARACIDMSVFTCEYEMINGSSTVDFLKLLEAADRTATKVHIIADAGSAQ